MAFPDQASAPSWNHRHPGHSTHAGRYRTGSYDAANRNHVECLWAKLKEWRAIATRYKKAAISFTDVL